MEIIGLVIVTFFIFGFMSYITGYKINPDVTPVDDNNEESQVDWLTIKHQTPLADEIIVTNNND